VARKFGSTARNRCSKVSGEPPRPAPPRPARGDCGQLSAQALDIGKGATLYLPPGLPIGDSRLLTFQMASKNVTPSQVHAKFDRKGPTLQFDGALAAKGNPIIVRLRTAPVPVKPNQRLVLAMELAGLCNDKNKAFKLGNGLCSTWELVDAVYANGELTARLESTGGMRLQFGVVPTDEE
jgi:hypothetical protein